MSLAAREALIKVIGLPTKKARREALDEWALTWLVSPIARLDFDRKEYEATENKVAYTREAMADCVKLFVDTIMLEGRGESVLASSMSIPSPGKIRYQIEGTMLRYKKPLDTSVPSVQNAKSKGD